MKRALIVGSLALPTLLAFTTFATADVKPHVLFTDGAVLQRDMPVPVWGTADDDEKVTVKFQGQEVSTTARDGKWMVKLAALKAGMAPKGSIGPSADDAITDAEVVDTPATDR